MLYFKLCKIRTKTLLSVSAVGHHAKQVFMVGKGLMRRARLFKLKVNLTDISDVKSIRDFCDNFFLEDELTI